MSRVLLLSDKTPGVLITGHKMINYLDDVFAGRDSSRKDHDLLDHIGVKGKVTLFRVSPQRIPDWVVEYADGNGVEITRGRSTKEIFDACGVSPEDTTPTETTKSKSEENPISSMKYNELKAYAVSLGLKTGNMKKKEILELIRNQ